MNGGFDDFFDQGDFDIDLDDIADNTSNSNRSSRESWDTGIEPDLFASGEEQDLFTTK